MTDGLHWTHLDAGSVPAWAELTNHLAEVDGTEEFYDAEDLAEELGESGFTPERDSWAVWSGEVLIAYGQLRVGQQPNNEGVLRCQLDGGVRKDFRGRGIGRRLMDLMEARATELAAQRAPGVPALWRASGGVEGASVRRLLAHRGYAVARYFNELALRLPASVALTVPDGVRLVSPGPEHEEVTRVAHHLAFADHWGSGASNPAQWHDFWSGRSLRFDVSTLALDAAGAVLAYVLAGQWVDRQLWIDIVGTIPSARGRGLAGACLGRTVAAASDSGNYDVVELQVDSESPTGAPRVYERLGFATTKTFATMQRRPPCEG